MKKIQIIMGIITVILVISVHYWSLYEVEKNRDHFIDNKINSKIIRVHNYFNKSLQYYYDEDYCITTSHTSGDTLIIGDSIAKEKNSFRFRVYRKTKLGKYVYFKEYKDK